MVTPAGRAVNLRIRFIKKLILGIAAGAPRVHRLDLLPGERRRRKPRYAVRKPKDYRIDAPGDLVQVDTLQVQLLPGEFRFQFSARDTITRFDGLHVYKRQTSTAGADFLQYQRKKFPFPSGPSRLMAGQSSRTSSRRPTGGRISFFMSFLRALPN